MGKREVIYNGGHDFTACFMKSWVKRRGGRNANADWKCSLHSNAMHAPIIIDAQSDLVMGALSNVCWIGAGGRWGPTY